jgi:HPt (histidine-containing phosphotransfer) domain-containing protein
MKASCKQFLGEQFNHDDEVVAEIYAEYTGSLREKIGEIAEAADGSQWDLLDRLAHTVKGNALVAGDEETAETAIAMRSAAKLRNADEVRRLLGRLRELSAEL